MTQQTARKWMSVSEVAELLGLKCSTIYAYIGERRIPYHKVPGSQLVRFKLEEIDAWMSSGRVETKAEFLQRKKGARNGPVEEA